jgi:hypothetical protein
MELQVMLIGIRILDWNVSNKIHISTAPHCEIHEVYEVSEGYLPMPLYTHRGKIKVVDET